MQLNHHMKKTFHAIILLTLSITPPMTSTSRIIGQRVDHAIITARPTKRMRRAVRGQETWKISFTYHSGGRIQLITTVDHEMIIE
jgi:hypothetical protein